MTIGMKGQKRWKPKYPNHSSRQRRLNIFVGSSKQAAAAILSEQKEGGHILISAITPWEIAMLIDKERLLLTMELDDWLAAVNSLKGIQMVPISPNVAVHSVRLPGAFHKDPADRLIVALAREVNVSVITADSKMHDYPHVHTIW
ncbi:MAG: type II toxin-antitoxin system VapC family toxin, partial [Nitrosospira sp.]|nr:type II toxin-antitoxin system VapC family toxin [Nitrosospira sp.]